MADISKEISTFKDAEKGEDVRQGFIDLAVKVNTSIENTQKEISQTVIDAREAANAANTAASNADREAASANSAAQRANAAAQACEDIASGAGYAQLRKDVDTIIALLNKAIITK